MKCDECKQLALNIDATSLIHLRVTAPHSPSTGQQSSPPPLGLSVFRTASDFLQDVKDSDTKENDLIVPNRPFDYFDLAPQNKPQLGDLIEIDRTLYSHWAVYVGGGRVVHVVGEENQDLPDTEHAVVREHFLIDIAVSSFVRVNNKEVPAKERGMASFDSDTVVANAKSMVGSRVVYNMLTKNCEHYLTEWKYGKAWSDQVIELEFVISMSFINLFGDRSE